LNGFFFFKLFKFFVFSLKFFALKIGGHSCGVRFVHAFDGLWERIIQVDLLESFDLVIVVYVFAMEVITELDAVLKNNVRVFTGGYLLKHFINRLDP